MARQMVARDLRVATSRVAVVAGRLIHQARVMAALAVPVDLSVVVAVAAAVVAQVETAAQVALAAPATQKSLAGKRKNYEIRNY